MSATETDLNPNTYIGLSFPLRAGNNQEVAEIGDHPFLTFFSHVKSLLDKAQSANNAYLNQG